MTINKLSPDVKNSNIEYCINEYVRREEDRDILRKHWFKGKSINELAEEYHKSDTVIKRLLYNTGDRILIKASKM
jgi:AraC-like DNA-binding protein